MRKSLENKIRFNIIFLYCLIALVCGGMLFYVHTFNSEIDTQKEKIEENNVILSLTNHLISSVQQTQTLSNLYISSGNESYLIDYQNKHIAAELIIDSLLLLSYVSTNQDKLLKISLLLNENKIIISRLNKQFAENNPFDIIHQKITEYKPEKRSDSLFYISTRHDTTMNITPKKSFWKRLGSLFDPKKSVDSTLTVSTLTIDTIKVIREDTSNILSDIQTVSRKASENYSTQLTKIRNYVNNLIISDQQISRQISNILIDLHRETIQSILSEIEASEQILKRNYKLLLIGGIIFLLLILIFISLIISDVNKGRAARKALEEANELTKRLTEERHELLLSVSHDIKAPLTSILGYADLWQQNSTLSTELSGLTSLQNSGNYILSLLENLLEFSKLEQGTLEINKTDFHVETLCDEIKEMFTPLINKKQLDFECDFSTEDILWIHSDYLKIKQIIVNVLSNAVKYTAKGKITFSIDYTNDKLRLVISDTGVGIPEKELDKLFKPFSRVERNNALAKGSGFGLYVVKGLVDLLQGVIVVQSKENEGTVVKISISAKEAKAQSTNFDENNSEKHYHFGKKRKLFVIDDDNSLLSMLEEMALLLEHEITTCNSLIEFEKQLSEISNYDFVLTDMEMGSFSGLDILQKVKEINSEIPVIVMTARSDFNTLKASAQGFDGFFSKPFTLKSLHELLGNKQKENNDNLPPDSTNDFKLLYEIFDGDIDAIKHILRVFVESTKETISLLQSYINENDFVMAQSLCHKMLPMFAQLEASKAVVLLKKMDSMRGQKADEYPDWKEDMKEFISLSNLLTDFIKEKHLVLPI